MSLDSFLGIRPPPPRKLQQLKNRGIHKCNMIKKKEYTSINHTFQSSWKSTYKQLSYIENKGMTCGINLVSLNNCIFIFSYFCIRKKIIFPNKNGHLFASEITLIAGFCIEFFKLFLMMYAPQQVQTLIRDLPTS